MPSTKVNVYFRADGNETIGLGHIVRCTALAEMIAPEFTAVFILRKSTSPAIRMISQAGFQYTLIEEEESFFSLLNSTNIAVTDGYEFDAVYFEKIIQTGARLVCIDDMVNTYYPAHLVINQNPAYTPQDYKAATYTQFAIGLDYALLRKPFRQAASLHKKAVKNGKYLIAMGGVSIFYLCKLIPNRLPCSLARSKVTDTKENTP
jgi:spore coat polysaccharide biosynthesis predicted glycosyltransferase SpsG